MREGSFFEPRLPTGSSYVLYLRMPRIIDSPLPVADAQLARSIASWVRLAPRHLFAELVDVEAREGAAATLGEIIVAEMSMTYPELVESSAPPLPF